jgi:hypothetical protein
MKLRQKDRSRLEAILADIERGIAFVLHPHTSLMRHHSLSSDDFFASTFPEYAGEKWWKITKECGNDFAGAIRAARQLRNALDESESPSAVFTLNPQPSTLNPADDPPPI